MFDGIILIRKIFNSCCFYRLVTEHTYCVLNTDMGTFKNWYGNRGRIFMNLSYVGELPTAGFNLNQRFKVKDYNVKGKSWNLIILVIWLESLSILQDCFILRNPFKKFFILGNDLKKIGLTNFLLIGCRYRHATPLVFREHSL